MFWDGFGRGARGSTNVENLFFQKCLGVFFPHRGHQNKRFGHTPGPIFQFFVFSFFRFLYFQLPIDRFGG